jgi:type I restriction enzyme S subunit
LAVKSSRTEIDKLQSNGELPKGWRMARFEEFAANIAERVDPTESTAEIYIGLEHLDSDSLKIRRSGSPDDVIGQKLKFKTGDVIFGRRRAYQRKLGIAECDGICSAHAMVVRAQSDVVEPSFLPFFMQSDIFMERAISISVGSLSPTINWKTMRAQRFALPPKPLQRKISETLGSANNVIESWLVVIRQLDRTIVRIRETEFANADSTPVRLAELCPPKGIQIGPFGSQLHVADYVDDGVPVVMPVNLSDDKVVAADIARVSPTKANSLSKHKLIARDILLARRGDLSKRAFVREAEVGWLCGTGSIRVRVKDSINARAVFHAIAAPSTVRWIERFAVGTTMPNTNADIVSKIPIHLPSESRCDALTNAVDKLEAARDEAMLHLEKAKYVRSKLYASLLTPPRS